MENDFLGWEMWRFVQGTIHEARSKSARGGIGTLTPASYATKEEGLKQKPGLAFLSFSPQLVLPICQKRTRWCALLWTLMHRVEYFGLCLKHLSTFSHPFSIFAGRKIIKMINYFIQIIVLVNKLEKADQRIKRISRKIIQAHCMTNLTTEQLNP